MSLVIARSIVDSKLPTFSTTTIPVVVGAGPAGIAAALTLASHHNYTVTLLESSPASSAQTEYDPTKAFLYNVNGRGQTLTCQFPNMQQKLVERSVPSGGFGGFKLTIVPGDPNEELPKVVEEEKTDGKTPEEDKTPELKGAMQSEKAAAAGYWLPRHEMVKLMAECIHEHNAKKDCENKITFSLGQECISVKPTREDGQSKCIRVKARNVEDGSVTLHQAALVVGADGMNSKVRQCLADADPSTAENGWQRNFNPKNFVLKRYTSPASHLRIKVLQLPPRFEIPDALGSGSPPLVTNSEKTYALRSVNTGPRNYLSLGLLPMKDNTVVRPTNIVTRPDHEVWTIRDGPTMQRYFQKAFPRYNFEEEGGMISKEEWDRFAKAEGTRFPYCQYSEGLATWVDGNDDDESGTCGVALVGDAIHAFPPDIGQGVNAGLMDVVCLDRALKGLDPETGAYTEKDEERSSSLPLETGLKRYQKRHAPEIAALIRLARFGAPYQYKQPHRADRMLLKFWTANVALRVILSKLTFGLVQPPSIMLSQNKDLTFRQVMKRADLTTALFKTILVGGFGFWVNQRFGFGFLKALLVKP
eukprot:CAMPEP_0201635820 /NCGR_PEP_ID=MMETSP0493-20130528/8207_1 /ASSEMBLY_ACC=CAM_ASM_000838 /TAXON_ID=420259 /ORGANISM="Thalassiosira gravida, Strain GMp14c1" /LENGTH=586 /DNA_ID=CAMNT_0048107831 /DNA_START=109 /DNA_END=1869 /DNA_ORIENTATION=+